MRQTTYKFFETPRVSARVRVSAQLVTIAVATIPSLAWATQACPEGTHPNPWWIALPLGGALFTLVVAWRVYKFMPRPWGAIAALVLCGCGLPLAALALIVPAPCVQ